MFNPDKSWDVIGEQKTSQGTKIIAVFLTPYRTPKYQKLKSPRVKVIDLSWNH